jgi:hypothetical protein
LTTELRHLGGALTPGRSTAGAGSGIDAAFLHFSATVTPDAGSVAVANVAIDTISAALAPWTAPSHLSNFAERSRAGAELFDAAVHRRLRTVKSAYDPADLMRSNHPVLPIES